MAWNELFLLFVVSHLVGDMLLQTNWQAVNKIGGLGRDRERRRALLAHSVTYGLAYVPVLALYATEDGDALSAVLAGLAIALPHYLQDDGRFVAAFMLRVKKISVAEYPIVSLAVDQTFHVLALLTVAAIAAA